jgi:hypothetical protein
MSNEVDITSFGGGPKSLVQIQNEQTREYQEVINRSNAEDKDPFPPEISIVGAGHDRVEINCSRRAAHDLVLGYMVAKQQRIPFSDAAINLIEELSAALIGRGAKP